MLVVKALETFSMDFNDYHLEIQKGKKYLFADDVFGALPPNFRKLFARAEGKLPPFYRGENLNGRTLLVVAQAAIGDALCMTPALREIKRRYPKMTLMVSISGRARPVLEGLPYLDEILPMPLPYEKVKQADFLVKCVEMVGKPQFDNLNLVEYFLWKFCIIRAEKEVPDVFVPEEVEKEVAPLFEEIRQLVPGKKILLFHYLASSVHRTLPPRLLKELEDLLSREYVPVICSLPSEDITVEVSLDVYGIRAANLSSYMKSVKHLAAAIKLSDAVITADTATLHLAAGLGKPTVFIAGPIEADLRSITYPTVIPVRPYYRGETCIAPCGQHATLEPCPEAKRKGQFYSPCLDSIPAEVIARALEDAEMLVAGRYERPENCPACAHKGKDFWLFEIINGFPIFECPSCGLQFAWPLQGKDYDTIYKGERDNLLRFVIDLAYEDYKAVEKTPEKEIARWENLPRFRFLLPILDALPRGPFLDVGCSTGFLLLMAQRLGFEVYGTEVSDEAIEIARQRFGLRVVKAESITELPQDFRRPYRVITALEVLEHLPDPLNFLKGLKDLLDHQGLLVLSCPPYYKFENLAKGYQKYKWWRNDYPPHHLTRWKPWTLYEALKKAGFSQIYFSTEPFLPGTLLEGIHPIPFTLELSGGQKLQVPSQVSAGVLIESMKPLYLNAPTLGNFQYVFAAKEKFPVSDFPSLLKRALRFSAIQSIWGFDETPKKGGSRQTN
ncbi:methyltransferase domain-containing protein [Thermosulfurimonas sp. F29]|uniref:methyltransferase domain-containing protein n=1 Tax=Thermosulfurimonas sp. F29 TaxID=2867247 RepID=UPI001C82DE9F|nr:methyltransferase domain-containing protein [Thermosulfurimonas sp. F29]MBX6422743.1 methyltransferase domain-containing protein [Thermosulfurimonas sp. F29]